MTTADLVLATKPFPILSKAMGILNDALTADVSQAGTVFLHVKNISAVDALTGMFYFEGSLDSTNGTDGTWFTVQAGRTNDGTIAEYSTGTLSLRVGVSMSYGWSLSVAGINWLRVRCVGNTSTGSLVTWTLTRSALATDPVPSIQAHPVYPKLDPQVFQYTTTASTNANYVRNYALTLCEITVFNPTTALVYLKLYNKAGAPTVGTDIPVMSIPVPVNGLQCLNFGVLGKRFTLGLGWAATGGAASTDVTAAVAGTQFSGTYIY